MKKLKRKLAAAAVVMTLSVSPAIASDDNRDTGFNRIASFPVFLNSDINNETVAEIVAATADGNTLIYTDSELEALGFVDITNPANPLAAGLVEVGGEPTSVAVTNGLALAGINTSPSFVAPSGSLVVVDIAARTIINTIDLGGQPDSVAISPDGLFAAVVIENERDEDLGNGEPPQAPGGFLVIVNLDGDPADWTTRIVNLDGVADLFPNDPEPEYVDINDNNVAVVTMQENNHIALVDLASGNVISDFPAGSVNLNEVDSNENDLIELNSSLADVPREPDGVTWINNHLFATADEGDLFGGSRGFTIYDMRGRVRFTAGNSVEHTTVRIGHYPEDRSENKGNEPENVEFGQYGDDRFLFVGSERSSVVLVYKLRGRKNKPKLVQVLPTGVKPEGLLAIPSRNLFITATEEDNRGDKIRATVGIYQLQDEISYPTIVSKNRKRTRTPIPWGALSGLAIKDDDKMFSVHDSFYQQSRIYTMDIEDSPAKIKRDTVLKDTNGLLAAVSPYQVNDDATVNLDLEGITLGERKSFWVVSEGRGTVGDARRPVESLNLLIQVDRRGNIIDVVTLPDSVNAVQFRFGFEGVAKVEENGAEILYVAFQREWSNDPDNNVRIGRYDTSTGEWTFLYYPIEEPLSANGGWVGLSEITALGNGEFAVIERDNQGGPDAVIKRLYSFYVNGLTALSDSEVPNFPVVSKTLVRDLVPDLQATGGLILEKIEGLAITEDGDALVVNDNDGVDDSNGETQLLRFNDLFPEREDNDDDDDNDEDRR